MMSQILHGLNAEAAHKEIIDVLGEELALKILDDLLESKNETVIINTTKAISQIPDNRDSELKLKTKTPLIKLANNGNAYAFEALYSEHDMFIESKMLSKIAVSDIEKLSPFYASQAFFSLFDSPPEQSKSPWLQKFFLHSASGVIDTHILSRILHSITGDSRFKIKFTVKPGDEITEFEKCGINKQKDIFDCFSLIKKYEKDLNEASLLFAARGNAFQTF